jgi:thioredoxin 1
MKLVTWEQKLAKYDHPVVVEFWAAWCGPCKMMTPALNQVKTEFAGRVDVIKVNADDEPDLMRELKIFSIPTVLVYQHGQLISRRSGALNVEQLRKLFDSAAKAQPAGSLRTGARVFRLLLAALLAGAAFYLNHNIPLYILAGLALFSAVYDRCPIWKALKTRFARPAGMRE